MQVVGTIVDGSIEVKLEDIDTFLGKCILLFRLTILDVPSKKISMSQLLAKELADIGPLYIMILVTDIFHDAGSYRIINALLRYCQIFVPHPDGVILSCDSADDASDAMTLLLLLYSDFVVYSAGANISIEFSHDGFCLVRANNDKHNAKDIIAICEQLMCPIN